MKSQREKLVIAFFGPDFAGDCQRDALTSWWNWTEGVCRDHGISLTHVGGAFREKPNRMRDNSATSIRRCRRRFQDQLVADNVIRINLDAVNDPKQFSAWDWILTSSCGVDKPGVRALFGLDCDAVSSWDAGVVSGFMRECLESAGCLRINYGFATIMPRDFFPAGYAIGITTRAAGTRLLHDTAAWRRHAERDCEHILRNLYGWNILTPEHLKIDIGGTPLKDWINASPKRGRLYEIAPPLWCWTFEDLTEGNAYLKWECEAVESIRQELEGYKLFPWQTIG